jgi:hypothetical protein
MTILYHYLEQVGYVPAVMKQPQSRTTRLMRRRTWCHASSVVVDLERGKGRTLTHLQQYHYRPGEPLRVPGV